MHRELSHQWFTGFDIATGNSPWEICHVERNAEKSLPRCRRTEARDAALGKGPGRSAMALLTAIARPHFTSPTSVAPSVP
jgi:hypothetical protein